MKVTFCDTEWWMERLVLRFADVEKDVGELGKGYTVFRILSEK